MIPRFKRAMRFGCEEILISGNIEGEDSEPKQKYESQKQMNAQLLEQKKWLEHELEEVGAT